MKKLIISTICSLFIINVQADYQIKYPLEVQNGGFLPNNSLNIKTSNTPVTECKFVGVTAENSPKYLWRSSLGGLIQFLIWNDVIVYSSVSPTGTVVSNSEFLLDNYKYTRGIQKIFAGPPQWEICRTNN